MTFSYSYHHLLTIRIRTVILSAARFARSPGEHVGHSIKQCEHGVKEANEVSGNDIFLYPLWGIDNYSLYKHRLQKFLSKFTAGGAQLAR